jgi:hypothetical protein
VKNLRITGLRADLNPGYQEYEALALPAAWCQREYNQAYIHVRINILQLSQHKKI